VPNREKKKGADLSIRMGDYTRRPGDTGGSLETSPSRQKKKGKVPGQETPLVIKTGEVKDSLGELAVRSRRIMDRGKARRGGT